MLPVYNEEESGTFILKFYASKVLAEKFAGYVSFL